MLRLKKLQQKEEQAIGRLSGKLDLDEQADGGNAQRVPGTHEREFKARYECNPDLRIYNFSFKVYSKINVLSLTVFSISETEAIELARNVGPDADYYMIENFRDKWTKFYQRRNDVVREVPASTYQRRSIVSKIKNLFRRNETN